MERPRNTPDKIPGRRPADDGTDREWIGGQALDAYWHRIAPYKARQAVEAAVTDRSQREDKVIAEQAKRKAADYTPDALATSDSEQPESPLPPTGKYVPVKHIRPSRGTRGKRN